MIAIMQTTFWIRFHVWKSEYFDSDLPATHSQDTVDNNLALPEIMDGHRRGLVYWRIYISLGHNQLTI